MGRESWERFTTTATPEELLFALDALIGEGVPV